jgi:hypothetical protein
MIKEFDSLFYVCACFYKKYTDFNAGIYGRVRGIYTDLKNMGLSK